MIRHFINRSLRSVFIIGVVVGMIHQESILAQHSKLDLSMSAIDSASAEANSEVRLRPQPIRWYTMFENLPRDWSLGMKVLFQQDKANEWLAVVSSTAILIATDDITYTPSDRFYRSSSAATYWSVFFAEAGDGRTQFTLAGTFGAFGLLFDDDRALRTGSQIVEVVLASGALVQVLKHSTGRESPFVRSTPTGRWSFFPNQVDYHRYVPYFDAYPSGHVTTSLATVTVIAENYPEWKWIRPVGYVYVALVGIGMGNNGVHWYSDYPLALMMGYYFGMIAAHGDGLTATNKSADRPAVTVRPFFSPQSSGLSISITF